MAAPGDKEERSGESPDRWGRERRTTQGRGEGAPDPSRPRTAGLAPPALGVPRPIPSLYPLVPTDMTSGEVALYILALLSSCQDPRRVHALEQTLDLIPILKHKMTEEISNNVITWYNESLDILALCLAKEYDSQDVVEAVAKELLNTKSSLGVGKGTLQPCHAPSDPRGVFGVLAVTPGSHRHPGHGGTGAGVRLQPHRRRGCGVTVPLPGRSCHLPPPPQALETSGEFYAPRKWDRAQAFSVVYAHDYQQPMAMAQVLPALVGRSYLDAANSSRLQHSGDIRAAITVQFSITNTLKNYFHYSTWVCVPDNSTLLDVMQVARNEKPDIFCFKIKWTHLGPFVTSIHGLAGNKTERTYWQFFSCWSPLQEGGYQGGIHDGTWMEP
uniref:Uncharacterized protein n=1 Tax=Cyanoderma ruficeps TaxID=181631 RepID=A0A8C3NQM7_9PASS